MFNSQNTPDLIEFEVFDQSLAKMVSQLYDPTDPEWTEEILLLVQSNQNNPELPRILKAGVDYNDSFKD